MSAARIDLPEHDDAAPYEIAWIKATLRGAKPDGPPAEFFSQRYRVIARAIHEDLRQGRTPDLLTLHERCDGATFDQIRDLANGLGDPGNIDLWIEKVRTAGLLRNTLRRLEAGAEQLRAGRNIESVLADLREVVDSPGPRPQKDRFPLLAAAELMADPKPVPWVVRRIIEAGASGQIYGDSGTYKTFGALDIGASTATGTHWHGHQVTGGPVVYICGEGFGGIGRRLKAWEIARGVSLDGAPLFISQQAAELIDSAAAAEVAAAVETATKQHGPPVLVVLDTFARNFGHGDENSSADVARVLANVDTYLRNRYGCAVMFVHHTGHGDKSRSRGSSALRAALDFEYRIERGEDDLLRMVCTKAKDHEAPAPLAFQAETIDLPWLDEDGEPQTSLALRRVDYEPAPAPRKQGLGTNQQRVLDLLADLYGERCQRLGEGGYPAETARVELSELRDRSGMDRRAFHKVKSTLVDRGLISTDGIFVFPGA